MNYFDTKALPDGTFPYFNNRPWIILSLVLLGISFIGSFVITYIEKKKKGDQTQKTEETEKADQTEKTEEIDVELENQDGSNDLNDPNDPMS